MHYFTYKNKTLYCEDVRVTELARQYGTPLYVYSRRTLLEHLQKIKHAFRRLNPLICYSVKANSNISVLKLLVEKGAGLDIVSGGELYRARKVRCHAKRVIYTSVGKTEREIRNAIKYGILMFNVESTHELSRINHVAATLARKVPVALRVNPDIEPHTHSYITTGKKGTKFGMDIDTVRGILLHREAYPNLTVTGLHLHIGSQITMPQPYIAAIKKVSKLLAAVAKEGVYLEYLNIGGGLGIVYDKEKPQSAASFASKVTPLLKRTGLKIILEPGRFIAGNAGVLLVRVLYLKHTGSRQFLIVDGAMNDLLRPSLYGAYHKILPTEKKTTADARSHRLKKYDIVGPICESSDFLGKDRKLAATEGDYLAVFGAGAYGFSMSSNYNSRPRAAEILVKGKKSYLIRERETYSDLIIKERMVTI